MSIVVHSDTGLHYRVNTQDLEIINEQSCYDLLFKNAPATFVFLDLGAHIGATATLALNCGAKKVICVEPALQNFELLKKNTEGKREVVLIRAAATDDPELIKERTTSLCVPTEYYTASGTIFKYSKDDVVEEIEVISFRELLFQYEPDVIKIDIEREEYRLDFFNLPNSVKVIAIEYHVRWESLWNMIYIHSILLSQQFFCVKQSTPVAAGKSYNTLGIYVRRCGNI